MEPRAYWNDETIERTKAWWIEDVHDSRLLRYLREETNLERCFRDGLAYLEHRLGGVRGTVLDLGAGVCWTTAIVSTSPRVEHVVAADFSAHRFLKVAPFVLTQYSAVESKIERRLSEMSEVVARYPDAAVDLVVFCQSLYMHDTPEVLLRDIHRVLRPGGVVMVSCELITATPAWIRSLRGWWRSALVEGPVAAAGQRPVARADASGRYSYLDADYQRFLRRTGFVLHVQRLDYRIFAGARVRAANYFGVKLGSQNAPTGSRDQDRHKSAGCSEEGVRRLRHRNAGDFGDLLCGVQLLLRSCGLFQLGGRTSLGTSVSFRILGCDQTGETVSDGGRDPLRGTRYQTPGGNGVQA